LENQAYKAAYRTKQAVSTITEAGGYCVFKKFIRQNFTGFIKKHYGKENY
jgi:hypothetical protein